MTYHGKEYLGARWALAGAVMAGLAMFATPGQASTITQDPVTLNVNGGDNLLSTGDSWLVNISGRDKNTLESMFLQVTATEDLLAIETNTFNLPSGWANPTIEWNTASDGSGTTLASLSTADLLTGSLSTMIVSFVANQTLYLIATWEGIGPGLHNWDIRISAVPLPAGLLLFLSGLAGIGFLGRYKAKRRETAVA